MIMNIRASRTIAAHSFIALPLPRTGNTDFSPVLIVRAIMAVAKGFCRGAQRYRRDQIASQAPGNLQGE
jgi:hypothetical protein